MRPPVIEQEGLIGALRQRLDAVEQRSGVETRLVAEELVDLPLQAEAEIYWIAQEALNNALKHAGATAVTIHTFLEDHQVVFEFSDNGCGFDQSAATHSGGMGLANMAARAEKLGGKLDIVTNPAQGTTIRIQMAVMRSNESM
jgi:signal transduction histidine kinase